MIIYVYVGKNMKGEGKERMEKGRGGDSGEE